MNASEVPPKSPKNEHMSLDAPKLTRGFGGSEHLITTAWRRTMAMGSSAASTEGHCRGYGRGGAAEDLRYFRC